MAPPSHVPKIKFNNGREIPSIGIGTWQSPPNVVKQAVKDAVNLGYRHIDGAYAYENETEIGEAIHELFNEGVVKREELFITSKLWGTFHSKARVPEAIKRTLRDLKLSYIDLYLIHWPMSLKESDEALYPKDENGVNILSDADYTESWLAMEELVKQGLVRSIGVSNFNSEQIKRILDVATIKPVTNQVECHPYLKQLELDAFCRKHDIILTAYAPLGSGQRPWVTSDDPSVLDNEVINALAKKYAKTPAQICIRYQLDRGLIVIPKSVNKNRIEENFQVFDFALSPDDVKAINSIPRNERTFVEQWVNHSPYYPFDIPF